MGPRTLHLWGNPMEKKPSQVSAESLALYWYLLENETEIELVFSNNVYLSTARQLPLLLSENGEPISGYHNIIASLWRTETINDRNQLFENVLLHFVESKINETTEYQLYLNRLNYFNFTRLEFTKLLAWPFSYNYPTSQRNNLRHNLGLSDNEEESDKQEDIEEEDLTQSKTFKLQKVKRKAQKEQLTDLKNNLKFRERSSSLLKEWKEMRYSEALLSDRSRKIPADYLLYANLYIQLNLPDGKQIREAMKLKLESSFCNKIESELNHYNKLADENSLKFRAPTFAEQSNVATSLYYLAKMYI
ncbi:hypothetical protein KAFR_0A00360 [Kazachstania africana CBS 2517]|uniref:Mitochondrial outer membrane transport complex Sam37/metaxin N-terminal domain-containing protein n=1 Tax=Kazachstania africana (strain ATCC 22294 / BCRC 22015 / CBS 2517 / CECT 1963 / NBRC 1671 / NRRL Y-8276) TaxID=1071382 RepID=H2AM74_KAZAF|nr:hypothetical protein KAFR_0A00360 [Kazachstania africana CBS 2517]CCF55474.1 hypothetical protein KAFR_0A00360 [Kazachstania africana CBS 2517]